MSMAHAIGIDLGTTYSAVARVDESGRTAMVRNQEGELLTPSVVLFEQDETIVGREAKKAAALVPHQVADCAKRDMGSESYSRAIGGQSFPPEVIQACILRKLRDDVVATVGENFKCVITVPAYFDEMRRKRTQDAGEMAGLDVLDIVNEPTAAALAFGEQLGYLSELGTPLEERYVLVYDLGGGTFDVTLIQLKPGEITTLATDGDVHLGGYDWDARLVAHAASVFQERYGIDPRQDDSSLAKLRGAVEEAKHTLTAREQASIRAECQGQFLEIPITRADFAELTADLLERTSYTTRQVIATAGLEWSQVDSLILVGGSSRMPMVSEMLWQLSGKMPDRSVNPDEAVARGAAIFADYLLSVRGESVRAPKLNVTDVNAHSLGIEGINNETLRKENVILIHRNTPLPAVTRRKFVTKEDNQRSIVIQVLEGESNIPTNCSPIGRAVIRQLPFGLPQGTRINVHYRYESNGRLSVQAELPGTGHQARLELEREQGLSSAGLNRWREVILNQGGMKGYWEANRAQQTAQPASASAGSPVAANPAVAQSASTATMPVPQLSPQTPTSPIVAGSTLPSPVGTARLRPEFAAAAGMTPPLPNPQQPPLGTPAPPRLSPPAEPDVAPLSQLAVPNQTLATAGGNVNSRAAARNGQNRRTAISLLMFVISSLMGLAIGYYILCYLRPEANFLKLPLPGIQQMDSEATVSPPVLPQHPKSEAA